MTFPREKGFHCLQLVEAITDEYLVGKVGLVSRRAGKPLQAHRCMLEPGTGKRENRKRCYQRFRGNGKKAARNHEKGEKQKKSEAHDLSKHRNPLTNQREKLSRIGKMICFHERKTRSWSCIYRNAIIAQGAWEKKFGVGIIEYLAMFMVE